MTEYFFSWQMLASFGGATAATALVTEFIKRNVDAMQGLLIHAVSYCVALGILCLGSLFNGNLDASSGVLCVFNAIAVSVAANGGYDNITAIFHSIRKSK